MNEELKKFTSSFDQKLVPDYIDYILKTFDSFKPYIEIVDPFERASDEFQTLTKYHMEALNNKEYNDFYMTTVKEIENGSM